MSTKGKLTALLVSLPEEQRRPFVKQIQSLLSDEYGVEIGNFEAEELMSSFAENMGHLFYNLGVQETRAHFESRLQETCDDAVMLEIEG